MVQTIQFVRKPLPPPLWLLLQHDNPAALASQWAVGGWFDCLSSVWFCLYFVGKAA